MLSDSELEALFVDIESDRVERKQNINDMNDIRQTICQFANDLADHRMPSVLFVGINDDGTCAGIDITDQLLLALSQVRDSGKLQPFPVMTVQKKTIADCELAVVEVSPSDMPPVRFNGRVWIRIGPRKGQATAEEERRLIERRRWGNLSFDQQPATPATLEDLDLEIFRREYLPHAIPNDVREANDRSIDHQLRALRFISRDGLPNHAAILLFGREPLTYVPGAYVQFVRYDGENLTDPILSQHDISGQLGPVLSNLNELMAVNLSISVDITSGEKEIENPNYPISALRQLLYNAVMHRSYEATNAPTRIYWFSDRIEILSPGGPYGQVSQENFGNPGVTDYRNPLLAEAMNVMGYVQRFGIGIQLARQELEKNRNPPLQFEVQPTAVLAIVYKRI